MCVVLQHIVARGPVAFPRPLVLQGVDPHRTNKTYRRFFTRRAWRFASPPAPNYAQMSGRLIVSRGSVPVAPDTPMTKGALHSQLDPLAKREISALPLESHRPTLRGLDTRQRFHR